MEPSVAQKRELKVSKISRNTKLACGVKFKPIWRSCSGACGTICRKGLEVSSCLFRRWSLEPVHRRKFDLHLIARNHMMMHTRRKKTAYTRKKTECELKAKKRNRIFYLINYREFENIHRRKLKSDFFADFFSSFFTLLLLSETQKLAKCASWKLFFNALYFAQNEIVLRKEEMSRGGRKENARIFIDAAQGQDEIYSKPSKVVKRFYNLIVDN